MELTVRQIEVLRELAACKPGQTSRSDGWATPQDFGGTNGSHHSETAKCLAKRGFVDRIKWGTSHRTPQINNFKCRQKGSCGYRITAHGIAALKQRGYKV